MAFEGFGRGNRSLLLYTAASLSGHSIEPVMLHLLGKIRPMASEIV